MGAWTSYRLRVLRKYFKIRARRKGRELSVVTNRTDLIKPDNVLLFCTFRNEDIRLPYFMKYYRDLGVDHFIFVDNDSTDGGREYVAEQPDASVWTTTAGYGDSRFGMDWLTWLQMKYAGGHWALTVDVDEFFVFPFCDTRPIRALGDWLDASDVRSFGAMLLDMYPKGPIGAVSYERGQNPMEISTWFDAGNYTMSRNNRLRNLWIQGGPRARMFFRDKPRQSPALNKIPFVKWNKRYVYASSTHMLLPRGLNLVYDQWGGEKASGILLHTKFLNTFTGKTREELERKAHYAKGGQYQAYAEGMDKTPEIWCEQSEKYINWRQLEVLGLMSKGNWA